MNKSERLNQEIIFLNDKHYFQLKDLMLAFQISKRTAIRDVQELERLGLPIYVENGKYGGYRVMHQNKMVPIYFSNEEVAAIFFALKALSLLSSTPFEESYSRIRQKLRATLSTEKRQYIDSLLGVIDYVGAPTINETDTLRVILDAIMASQILTVVNTQYELQTLNLQIYELFFRNGIWFCSAYDVDALEWGTYRCDYLKDLTVNTTAQTTYTKAQLKQFQDIYEATYHNIAFDCRLTALGKERFLKNRYPNMRLAEMDGQPHIVGGYNASELGYMTNYLISLGEDVAVIYPKALKQNVVAKLKEILKQYEP